ncbi:conserved hypothetical protein [Burkholderia cenocepacia]|nr:conserved hypothetical protein [Burkholderia cenocepacia]
MPIENIVAAAELSATTDPVGNCTGTSPRATRALTPISPGTAMTASAGADSRVHVRLERIACAVATKPRMRVVTD